MNTNIYTDCNESKNIFISSRGLLKSCDIRSNTPISSIRYLINYPNVNINKNYIPTIYVCNSAIKYFATNLIVNIDFPFILVSGDSDEDRSEEHTSELQSRPSLD
jgi:hypothetical protein